jgi:hypothetical protein
MRHRELEEMPDRGGEMWADLRPQVDDSLKVGRSTHRFSEAHFTSYNIVCYNDEVVCYNDEVVTL